MLSIGEFARASGLSTKALRLYDELDLLRPAEVEPRNGYRFYSPEQIDQARLVARLRSAGVPLPRIAAIIAAPTPQVAADEVLSYWRHVEAERASAREVITSLVALLQGGDTMSPTLGITLENLISGVQDDLPDGDGLSRITEARLRAKALADLGDQLIDHYVGEAKLAGASWPQISAALGGADNADSTGSADPAGRGRRPANAFERFTDLNRHAVVLAQEAARTHRHELIGTDHLLLGLLAEPRGLAHQLLIAKAGSEQQARNAIEQTMAPLGQTALQGHIAFAPDCKLVIEQALRASADLGHEHVGTEHTLLGLLRVEQSPAAQILRDLGFTADDLLETVRSEVDGAA